MKSIVLKAEYPSNQSVGSIWNDINLELKKYPNFELNRGLKILYNPSKNIAKVRVMLTETQKTPLKP